MMTEVAEAAVTDAAPEAQEPSTPVEEAREPTQEPTQETQPEPARNIAEIKRGSRERLAKSAREIADAKEVARREAERPRDEQGRFVKQEEPAQVEESVPGAEVAETDPVPEGFVRIELPEGSKLRQTRGLEHWDVPEDRADDFRYYVNLEQKEQRAQAEWDRLKTQNAELNRTLIQLQAEAEYFKTNTPVRLDEQQLEAMRQDFVQAYGEEMGAVMFEGAKDRLTGENPQALDEARQNALMEAEVAELQQQAETFRTNVIRYGLYGDGKAQPWFPGWTEAGMEQALKAYGMYLSAEIDSGRELNPDPKEFFQLFALPAYRKTEAGRQHLDRLTQQAQERQLEEARKKGLSEAKAAEEARLKEAAERHRTNPAGRLPVRQALAATGHRPDPEQTDKTLTPTQRKRNARERIKQRFAG